VAMLWVFAAVACGGDDGGGSAAEADVPAGEDTLPGSTTITAPPAPDGPLPAVQIIEPDPDDPMNSDPVAPGAQRIRYAYGPVEVKSGQNNIEFSEGAVPRPDVDGWVTRIAPNLMRADGSIPAVDVIHLHHGVWLNRSRVDATAPLPERMFAAGEEKTIFTAPEGYGYRYDPEDDLVINYMIHNLFPAPDEVWITYDYDFIPADAPEAEGLVHTRPVWMDVQNGDIYPVFDVIKGDGDDGTYTYPDDAPADDNGHQRSRWTVDRDGLLVLTAGHLHPGGLSVDLYLERDGDEVHIFNSEAVYFDEVNGPVSWDVAMTATPEEWIVAVREGDVLRISTTYDTTRASWYESMGIMVIGMADAADTDEVGLDPFVDDVPLTGEITHDHLEENDNPGGEDADLPDPADLPDGPEVGRILIEDYIYEYGDFSKGETEVPLVRAGEAITYDNSPDAPLENGIWHTITSCELPCNRSTGIAYPLADAEVQFDSGQLSVENAGAPTAGRVTWDTPIDLAPGTYAYYCRVHPFMRGAFRVID
jgi:plastocyanin